MRQCPNCELDCLVQFDLIEGTDRDYWLSICKSCLSIVNVTAYELAGSLPQREIQKIAAVDQSSITSDAITAEVHLNEMMLQNLLRTSGRIAQELVFCDFGAGRGVASLAAEKLFKRVIAVDLDSEKLRLSIMGMSPASAIEVREDFLNIDVPVDFFFAWHAIEHLQRSKQFFMGLSSILAKNAVLAMQVPLFRPDYVIDCHYSFFSEASFNLLANHWGLSVIRVETDKTNGFVTLLATPAPREDSFLKRLGGRLRSLASH